MQSLEIAGLVKQAVDHYNGSQFDLATNVLKKISEKCPGDLKTLAKLRGNQSLLEFKQSGYASVKNYQSSLIRLFRDQNISLDGTFSGLVEHLFILYNYALTCFHTGEYRIALRVLKRIVGTILMMTNSSQIILYVPLFRECALLLSEMALIMCQAERVQEFISYLEDEKKYLRVTKEDRGTPPSPPSDQIKYRLQQVKIREALMSRDARTYRKEIKILSGFQQCQQFKTAFFKGMQEYQKMNFKKAIKFMSSIMTSSERINDFSIPMSDRLTILTQNAFGCIYGAMEKPNLARVYFTKSLSAHHAIGKTIQQVLPNDPMFSTGNQLLRCSLLYNLGLSLLHGGQPAEAFDCFVELLPVFVQNPRLWLRTAECCMALDKLPGKSGVFWHEKKRFAQTVKKIFGMGPHRKLAFDFCISQLTKAEGGGPAVMPLPNVQFACYCLTNALTLVNCALAAKHISTDQSDETGDTDSSDATVIVQGIYPAGPGNLLSERELKSLQSSIYCASAYVHLSLGDAVKSLEATMTLIALPQASNAHKMLGRLYAAESLIQLNNIDEALNVLNPRLFEPLFPPVNETGDSDSQQGAKKGSFGFGEYPQNASSMQAIISYNRALMYVMRADYVKAGDILSSIQTRPKDIQVPVHAVLLVLFVHLQKGRLDYAQRLIADQFPNLLPPRLITSADLSR